MDPSLGNASHRAAVRLPGQGITVLEGVFARETFFFVGWLHPRVLEDHPRMIRARCTAPSSTRRIGAPLRTAFPSISVDRTPRQTPWGFSTFISYRVEW